MLNQFAALSVREQKSMLASLRDVYAQARADLKAGKALLKADREAARAAKKAERIAKLQAKIDALTNPVGTKARKANKKPGAVKVYNPEEIAEANAIAAKIQAKKA